ncbi:peptidyl-alpha-hydroxyglycine alpha-amidating lyase 1-like isoform X3 [Bombus affinis]|uniref:peptidyl-alpha-hydroxyglycine alpha-amidating lyase 1-like isoform X3 n=1 Tax=Bombus affinis TaxID=309941 RepID=UPI0021B81A49|nr:peptidyl-alpha-hydroxyglycine alpha-amidating lyase 1-like isoform X3 [Bombus affinis]
MVHLQYDIACCISVLFILSLAEAGFLDYLNLKRSVDHLPDNTLGIDIEWDSQWAKNIKFGQVSAVSIDPSGNIGILHRGSRVWGSTTFNIRNIFNKEDGPIQENTVVLLDKSGKKLSEWGAYKFYLPHGLTIDMHGNYWITDVALHQVFKFDAKDIEMMKGLSSLRKRRYNQEKHLRPSLTLGEAFVPGNDDKRFCKPTAVAVENNGDFFVSDGYCNTRILKFNAKGERILHWGRGSIYGQTPVQNAFNIPHALALASELNLLFVADRENGRIVSFYATNGTFHKEYKNHTIIGALIYSVAYAKGRLYLINGRNSYYAAHVRGSVLDVYSGDILLQFGPGQDMDSPHDIAVSQDGSEIYVVELNKNIAYKFSQMINTSIQTGNFMVPTNPHQKPALLTDIYVNQSLGGIEGGALGLAIATAILAFIFLCVAIGMIITRSQKRDGCWLIMRKRMRWEAERRENYKLPNLLENRRSKSFKTTEKRPNPRDFNKLNTEPETSEDEYPDNSITKII